ncbi:ATP-binding protein [Croceicoccus hydrothermalis]|uniref:ATP-binding protein n=1 Tax=Croceicoccus hydrothermalis TaxID=2867964 RepID=UPI001EFC2446|nr:ATP-binding protein [Croceicoccus hydrothermalis]
MSLSLRGLAFALPIVGLVIGVMTWFAYNSTVADYRDNRLAELVTSNASVHDSLRREMQLIANVQRQAATIMARRIEAGPDTRFDRIFEQAPDGAYHTRDDLWSGRQLDSGIVVKGLGGFVPPDLSAEARRTVLPAAFETIAQMVGGLPHTVESLYFFSPDNELLIYAPQRADRLGFYRSAPADFDFQDLEFTRITTPRNNPAGEMRCTSLQNPAYDDTGRFWTTGCMLPFRPDDRHMGAWGISIPLEAMTGGLRPPPPGARTIILGREGKLVHDSALIEEGSRGFSANIDLSVSKDDVLRNLALLTMRGELPDNGYVRPLDAYVSVHRLASPNWTIVTMLPQSELNARGWAIAWRVIVVSASGTIILALLLAAIFDRFVAARITRLARRADNISATHDTPETEARANEIDRLEQAFHTMEQRLEADRVRARRSFDTLIDAAQGYAMVLFDTDGTVLRANRGAIALLGEQGIQNLAPLRALENDESSAPRLVERPHRSGGNLWLEESFLPLHDDNGVLFGAAYIAHDLTDQRTRQREIEQNLLFLELAQTNARIGHFMLDPGTMRVSLSRWIRDRIGIEEEYIPLGELVSVFDADSQSETIATIRDVIGETGPFSFETQARAADGTKIDILIKGTAVSEKRGQSEQISGYYGIVQDVTREKAAQAEILSARDAAQAEAEARSDLLAVVSHEIRTPISGIFGLIDHVRRERSPDERNRILTLIKDSAEALLSTLDNTLQGMRAERQGGAGEIENFRPDDLVGRVAELFRPLARRKGLIIEMNADKGTVAGRPARIQQILANFISNAVKFTPSGRISIRAIAPSDPSATGDDAAVWTFTVTDTGGGIPPERLSRLFTPFAGSSADTLGRRSGSGLGLSITRKLAEEMGGTVSASSEEGKGTCMTLRLPLPPAENKSGQARICGTIAIELSSATLAIQVEAIAAAHGFLPPSGDAPSDAANIVVADRMPEETDHAEQIIVVGEHTPGAKDTVRFVPGPRELIDILPDVLQACGDA